MVIRAIQNIDLTVIPLKLNTNDFIGVTESEDVTN